MTLNDSLHGETLERDLSLAEIIAVLWSNRWLLLGCVLTTTVLCVAASFLVTPKYRLTTTLVAASGERSMGIGDLAGQLTGFSGLSQLVPSGDAQKIEETIAVLRSRAFLENFIDSHDLLPMLFSDQYDFRNSRWKDEADVPSLWQGYEYLSQDVLSIVDGQSGSLVQLAIVWMDPDVGATWANQLVADVNELMRLRAIEEAEKSLEFLRNEVEKTNLVGVKQSIYGLIETQVKSRMIANVRPEFVFRVVDPARPPDVGAYFRPKRALWAISGLMLGLLVGCIGAFVSSSRRHREAR